MSKSKESKNEYSLVTNSPLGRLRLVSNKDALLACEILDFQSANKYSFLHSDLSLPILQNALSALQAYFRGKLDALEEIPFLLQGSSFQQDVWKACRRIGPAKTLSYAELASLIGRPRAARAIGNALAANKLCLFIPCHRVLAASKALGGFSGGVQKKRFLLAHEGAAFR